VDLLEKVTTVLVNVLRVQRLRSRAARPRADPHAVHRSSSSSSGGGGTNGTGSSNKSTSNMDGETDKKHSVLTWVDVQLIQHDIAKLVVMLVDATQPYGILSDRARQDLVPSLSDGRDLDAHVTLDAGSPPQTVLTRSIELKLAK